MRSVTGRWDGGSARSCLETGDWMSVEPNTSRQSSGVVTEDGDEQSI